MSSSMTLEENFEALMKSYQTIPSSNKKLKHSNDELKQRFDEEMSQNAYLRMQLDKLMKQK